MKKCEPRPGDLILVLKSEWSCLKDGELLRVCEKPGWIEEGEAISVAPRHQVNTFWGPHRGAPDGIKLEYMSTSGGPFMQLKPDKLEGLELVEMTTDRFWRWIDWPRSNGGIDRMVEVTLWRLPLLIDDHYRNLVEHGLAVPHA